MCHFTHLILSILILVGVRTGEQIQSSGPPTLYQNDLPLNYHNDPVLNFWNGSPQNYQNGPPPNYQSLPPEYMNRPNYRNGPALNYQNSSYLRSLAKAVTRHEVVTAPPTRHYDPNYGYKEYWPGGQWVLYSTKIGGGRTTTTKTMPTICGMECPAAFHDVGKVCGRWSTTHATGPDSCPYSWVEPTDTMKKRCHNWYPDDYSVGYHTYESYCSFLNEECTSAKNFDNQTVLVFVHGGECKEQSTYFLPMGGDLSGDPMQTNMEHRLKEHIKKIDSRFNKWDRTRWAIAR